MLWRVFGPRWHILPFRFNDRHRQRLPAWQLLRRGKQLARHLRHRRVLVPHVESIADYERLRRGPLRYLCGCVGIHQQHLQWQLRRGFLLPTRLYDESRRRRVRRHAVPRGNVRHRRVDRVILQRIMLLHSRPLLRAWRHY
jgi:hypothetical protein